MPIDASIYQAVKPIETPSIAGTMQNAYSLANLGMQNQQMQYQLQGQQAMRDAYANNTDQQGNVDQNGIVRDVAKVNPMYAMQMQQQLSGIAKNKAETTTAQMAAAHQVYSVGTPMTDYLLKQPEDQAAIAYPAILKQMGDQGVPVQNFPATWDRAKIQQIHDIGMNMKEQLENELIKSNIGQGPAKLNSDLYGSRSPNAELTSQYDKQAQPVRQSQIAMKQMLDNYNHTTPQGDASLVLNAFKIKFPTAPDVNSLEELSKSQSASDTWRNMANKALAGGLDQQTRDNLMRDGVSTFRANVQSLQGIQQRYQARARAQNVNDPTLTSEPAVDKTYAEAMDLQKQIGPYVPPSGRGGITGAVSRLASKLTGVGAQTSNAAAPAVKPGAVEGGYVFMGGDPGQQKNWKRTN